VVDRGVAEPGRHTVGLPDHKRGEVVIRRSPTGWRVEGSFPALPTDTVDDLGIALVLADLLAEGTVPGPRPPRPADGLDEVARLRASVRQLEHALASRVIVEQAIGVLAERWCVAPRDAFEQLRRVTRSHGLRIHDLAKLVIESSTDRDVGLPPELAQPPAGAPPEPRQSPDARGRATEPGERRRTRRAEAPATGGRAEVSTNAPPAPRLPQGRHARVEH
jgi:ANTAR domain